MKLIMMACAFALTACSAQERRDSALADEREVVTDYCRELSRGPAMDPIRRKVPFLMQKSPTLEMLSDSSYATDQELPAILALDSAIVECSNRRAEMAQKFFGSDYVAVERAAASDAQRNRLDLYQGKITWGQYISKAQSIADEAMGMFASLDQRHRQMAINQQSANAQSAGAAAAMMQTQALQPIRIQPLSITPVAPPPRPINCTSVRQGAYTTTNCQ